MPVLNYTMDSNNQVFAGRRSKPSWVPDLYHWGEMPTSNVIADLDPEDNPAINPNYPSSAPWRGTGGQPQVIAAWSSGIWDYIKKRFAIYFAGGHFDYGGNERYDLNCNFDDPSFTMIIPPSGGITPEFPSGFVTNDGQEGSGVFADGRPRNSHSYGKLVFIPNVGYAVSSQNGVYASAGAGTRKTIIFDSENHDVLYFDGDFSNSSAGAAGIGACYDPNRHAIWAKATGSSTFSRFSLDTKLWTNVGSILNGSSYRALEFMPEHDAFICASSFGIHLVNAATGAWQLISFTGSLVGTAFNGWCQPRYIGNNEFLLWDNATDTTVINKISFASDPFSDTWEITQLFVAPTNTVTPTAKTPNGTYGRFWVDTDWGVCFVLNGVSQRPFVYRYK